MELGLYWHIVTKRLWLVLILLLGFLLSYLFFGPQTPTLYTASMRFVIGLEPEPISNQHYTYDRYYTWLTAEYLLDDLAEVVKSQLFAQNVADLAQLDVPVGAIQGATSAGKLHRILTINVTWHDQAELARIADAVVQVLCDRGDTYFAQLSTGSAVTALIDPPTIRPVGPSLRQRLDLPIRLMLALGTGIALAFLLDYLDDSIRDRSDLEELNLTILAEIPTRRRWLSRLWHRRSIP